MLKKFSSTIYVSVFLAFFVLAGISAGFFNLTARPVSGQDNESEILEIEGDFVRRISFGSNDIIFNPHDQMLYASRPSSVGSGGNSIARINPLTGELVSSVYVGSEPGKLALSDNGQSLYVVLDGAYAVRRFDTVDQTAGNQFSLGGYNDHPFTASDIAVAPGNPDTVAVARYRSNISPPGQGVAIFQNGVRLPNVGPGHSAGANYLAFSNSPNILYGGGQYEGLRTMTVDGGGVAVQPLPPTSFDVERLKFDGGKLYTSNGTVIEPQSRTVLGTFPDSRSSAFVPDSAVGRVFYAVGEWGTNTITIKAFDINTFVLLGSLTIPNVPGDPVAMVRYKSNGLALKTSNNQLFLIQTGLIPTNEPLPAPSATPTVTPMPPTVYQSSIRELPLAGKDLIYNETTGKLYASVVSADASRGNTVTTIDPASGNFENSVHIGSEPGELAISDNRQTLYVGLNGAGAIRKFDIPSQTAGAQFSLPYDSSGPVVASGMDFMPGSSDTIAVSSYYNFGSLAIYDAGVKRPQAASAYTGPIEFDSNSTIYMESYGRIGKYAVNPNGVAFQAEIPSASNGDIKLANGLVYTGNGRIFNTDTQSMHGTFSGVDARSPLAIDVANNRAFFVTQLGYTGGYFLRAYALDTFLPVGSIAMPPGLDTPLALTRWGTNGLAFLGANGKIYLIQSNLVSSSGSVPTVTPTATPTPALVNSATFFRTVPLPANDLVYSSATGALYASVPSVAGVERGNTITKINPATGALDSSVSIGSEPSRLALSSDAGTLYAKLDGTGNAIRRFDIPSQTAGAQFSPGSEFQYYIEDMDVMPGNPQTIAIAGRNNRIAVFDNGVRRASNFTFGVYNVNSIEFSDASTVYGYERESSRAGFVQFDVSGSVVTGVNLGTNLINFPSEIKYFDGRIYSSFGRVLDPVTKNLVGTFNANGTAMTVDAAAKRIFFLKENVLSVFDTETFAKIGAVTLPVFPGTPTSLVRWGENGLAFRTADSSSSAGDSRVYILQSALAAPNSTVPTGIQFRSNTYNTSEYSGTIGAVILRTGDLSTASTVNYATVDGTARAGEDYTATAGTLTFAPGESSKTIGVQLLRDDFYDGTEDFQIVLSDPSGANATLVYPSNTVVNISDSNYQPHIFSNNLTLTEPVAGVTRQAVFTIRLNHRSVQTVSVNYATSNGTASAGSDYQAVSGSLTFAPFEQVKTVSVPILGDVQPETNETFYLNLTGAVNGSVSSSQIAATIVNYTPQTNRRAPFDFDGDNRSDVSVFRPADSVWHFGQSQEGYGAVQFGFATDKIVPADYDGDGKTDVAVFRDGVWHLLKSTHGYASVQFGLAGDVPVPADYDGDGLADLAVFRPSDRFWYIWNSSGAVAMFQFGLATDKLVPADYDGDGKTDVAVWRPENGVWYVQASADGFMTGIFGLAGDVPVQADYDGDRKTDLAVFREGFWYIQQTRNNQVRIQRFGLAGDKPVVADYDGDGVSDIAVFRQGIWYFSQYGGSLVVSQQFGLGDDLPVPNAYVP
jgi:hypothetical protein